MLGDVGTRSSCLCPNPTRRRPRAPEGQEGPSPGLQAARPAGAWWQLDVLMAFQSMSRFIGNTKLNKSVGPAVPLLVLGRARPHDLKERRLRACTSGQTDGRKDRTRERGSAWALVLAGVVTPERFLRFPTFITFSLLIML